MSATKVRRAKRSTPFRQEISGLLDYISPSVLNFTPRRLQMGSEMGAIMTITHFPTKAQAAWLSRIITMPGVTSSIHVQPTNSYSLIESLNVSIGVFESRLQLGMNALQEQRAKQGLKDAQELLKKIDLEQQQVSYMTVVLLIIGKDEDQLNERIKRVESRLASAGMRGRIPIFKQQEGLRSLGPWNILEKDIFDISARNMPSESIAAAYPFVYSGINDGSGCLLGQDHDGGIVLVDFWKREGDRTNSNKTIMGKPGVGKSTLVKKLFMSEWAMGRKIIIIDPEREYKELCENLNGTWIDCGGGKSKINPLQVRDVPLDDDDEDEDDKLYDEETVESGPLSLHFQTLRTFFSMYLKNVEEITLAYLEQALEQTYNNFKISWDVDPSTLANDEWPILSDLYDVITTKHQEDPKNKHWEILSVMLRSVAVGADSAIWNGHTTVKADSDFIVLDINRLLEADEKVLRTQFYNLLGWTWNEASRDRTEKVLIGVDEAYLLADPEETQPLKFLRNTSKRIRKYEGGIVVIFHNLIDFMDPTIRRYGQALIDNPTYKIIMGQGEKDVEALTQLMTLSEREVQTLHEGKRGDALFFAGNKRIRVSIEATPFELEMFGAGGGR